MDLNGDGAGNGNGYALAVPPAPAITATTDKLAMTDDLNSSATGSALQGARFSLATLLANDVGTGLSITAVGGANGAVTGVTLNADGTVSVQSAANASTTSGQIVTGSFTYTLSNDTLTGTANADFLVGGTGDDTLNTATGNDSVLGGAGNDSVTAGAGIVSLNGGDGNDILLGDGLIGAYYLNAKALL